MQLRAPLLPRWVRWLVAVGLAGFIFYVSVVTVPPETVVDTWKPTLLPLDKWRHFVAYATLGYALAYAMTDSERPTRRLAALVVGAVVVYGVGIEVWQAFVPQRYFSVGDAYANALGGVLVVPYYVVARYVRWVPVASYVRSLSA